ncbi:MAG: GFA family protein, partial [Polyangiales bacterium]
MLRGGCLCGVVTRSFCPTCGSQLFGRNTGMAGFTTVAAGTLDDPDLVVPQVVVFARTKRRWDPSDAALPTY